MKILVCDDEKNIRELIRDYLSNEGYDVTLAKNGYEAIDYCKENLDLDLVLLDIRMPELDGFETLEALRDYSKVPVLFLTALNDLHYEIKGLDMGADDYVTKPFTYDRLLARVRAALRRNSKGELVKVGALEVHLKVVSAKLAGQSLDLTQKEYELLKLLLVNKGQTLERLTLIDKIWGYDFEGDPRTLDTHIKTLRFKLGDIGKNIKTMRGVGYRFEE